MDEAVDLEQKQRELELELELAEAEEYEASQSQPTDLARAKEEVRNTGSFNALRSSTKDNIQKQPDGFLGSIAGGVEDAFSAVAHPIDTAKGIYRLGSKVVDMGGKVISNPGKVVQKGILGTLMDPTVGNPVQTAEDLTQVTEALPGGRTALSAVDESSKSDGNLMNTFNMGVRELTGLGVGAAAGSLVGSVAKIGGDRLPVRSPNVVSGEFKLAKEVASDMPGGLDAHMPSSPLAATNRGKNVADIQNVMKMSTSENVAQNVAGDLGVKTLAQNPGMKGVMESATEAIRSDPNLFSPQDTFTTARDKVIAKQQAVGQRMWGKGKDPVTNINDEGIAGSVDNAIKGTEVDLPASDKAAWDTLTTKIEELSDSLKNTRIRSAEAKSLTDTLDAIGGGETLKFADGTSIKVNSNPFNNNNTTRQLLELDKQISKTIAETGEYSTKERIRNDKGDPSRTDGVYLQSVDNDVQLFKGSIQAMQDAQQVIRQQIGERFKIAEKKGLAKASDFEQYLKDYSSLSSLDKVLNAAENVNASASNFGSQANRIRTEVSAAQGAQGGNPGGVNTLYTGGSTGNIINKIMNAATDAPNEIQIATDVMANGQGQALRAASNRVQLSGMPGLNDAINAPIKTYNMGVNAGSGAQAGLAGAGLQGMNELFYSPQQTAPILPRDTEQLKAMPREVLERALQVSAMNAGIMDPQMAYQQAQADASMLLDGSESERAQALAKITQIAPDAFASAPRGFKSVVNNRFMNIQERDSWLGQLRRMKEDGEITEQQRYTASQAAAQFKYVEP